MMENLKRYPTDRFDTNKHTGKNAQRFLWFAAGAKGDLLQKYGTEHAKYSGIGLTIVFTAILASLSGGYALYTVFENPLPAIGFGVLWGLIIFNLDRFIVSSMRKGDGFFRELAIAFPRIILATFLALVISKPLELRLFEREIEEYVTKQHEAYVTSKQSQQEVENQTLLMQNLARKNELEQLIQQKQTDVDEAEITATQEAAGEAGRPAGEGPIFRKKKARLERLVTELDQMKLQHKEELGQLNTKIIALQNIHPDSLLTTAEQKVARTTDAAEGFLESYMALMALSAENPSARHIGRAIMFIFFLLETAPIIVKLMSKTGPYDHALRREELTHTKAELQGIDDLELGVEISKDMNHVIHDYSKRVKKARKEQQKRIRHGVRNLTRDEKPPRESKAELAEKKDFTALENRRNGKKAATVIF